MNTKRSQLVTKGYLPGFTLAQGMKTQTNYERRGIMALNKLASAIANQEGKKHQASIGDIREILKIIVDFEAGSIVDVSSTSPCRLIRVAAMDYAKRLGYFGGKSATAGSRTKVSKEDQVKAGRNRKTKRAGQSNRRTTTKARK